LRLRQLEEVGVVKQTSGPGGQEYILTDAGREFGPIVEKLGTWGQHWFRTTFSKDELDVTLLMWDMRRTVRPEAFPPGQNTVQLELAGVPAGKRNWWLVCNAQEVDLCATDPGFEVDLFVTTDLKTATRIWMGDLAVKAAMSMGSLKLNGSRDLQRHFEAWLGRSSFAGVEDARRAAR
jgi:hypothetical protein